MGSSHIDGVSCDNCRNFYTNQPPVMVTHSVNTSCCGPEHPETPYRAGEVAQRVASDWGYFFDVALKRFEPHVLKEYGHYAIQEAAKVAATLMAQLYRPCNGLEKP